MNVVWRPQARDELAVILAKISQDSPKGAARMRARILHSISFLRDWPDIGRPGRRGFRELVVPRTPYVVIFKRDADLIRIFRVVHAARRR
jgi:toxin ParE1/3/4